MGGLSLECKAELKKIYDQGVGDDKKNRKGERSTAQSAVTTLESGLLKRQWDMKYVCSVTKVKSYFGKLFQDTKKGDDERRKKTTAAPATVDVAEKEDNELEEQAEEQYEPTLDEEANESLINEETLHGEEDNNDE